MKGNVCGVLWSHAISYDAVPDEIDELCGAVVECINHFMVSKTNMTYVRYNAYLHVIIKKDLCCPDNSPHPLPPRTQHTRPRFKHTTMAEPFAVDVTSWPQPEHPHYAFTAAPKHSLMDSESRTTAQNMMLQERTMTDIAETQKIINFIGMDELVPE